MTTIITGGDIFIVSSGTNQHISEKCCKHLRLYGPYMGGQMVLYGDIAQPQFINDGTTLYPPNGGDVEGGCHGICTPIIEKYDNSLNVLIDDAHRLAISSKVSNNLYVKKSLANE